jgi:thioredoxin-like negative regulator of GroEL
MSPIFDSLAAKYSGGGVVFAKMDHDENEDLVEKHFGTNGISLPSFAFFRAGLRVDLYAGSNATLLEQKLKVRTSP